MDLSFLDKSSNVTPLLVRLYDSHKLYGLAKNKRPLARAALTSALEELLSMELSTRESELIADVLITLIRQAEQDLKEAMAERLSLIDDVPLRLILQMANDDITVARPVLKNSSVLGDLDLIYIIKSKSTKYWQAIAERKDISDQVINVLSDTKDIETGIKLVENNNITLTEHALGVLSDIAQGADNLAQPLLRREEVGPELARSLYNYVGAALKDAITEKYPLESEAINGALDKAVQDLDDSVDAVEFYPSPQLMNSAQRYKESGLLTSKLMLGALQRGQINAYVAQFSRFSGLTPDVVLEILAQKTGQGLAVACRALQIEKCDFVSMFLLTNRVRNNAAMVDVRDMSRAVEYYNRVKPSLALQIMNGSSGGITRQDH